MLTTREFHRKLFHLIMGLVTVILIYFDILSALSIFLLIIAGLIISFLSKRVHFPVITDFLNYFERADQRYTFPGRGTIFFFAGVLLVMKLFEKDIALASIMVLTIGDSVSHLFGAKFGQIKNIFNGKSKKLLEGTLAGTIAGFLGALFFVPVPEAFLGGLGAMMAEVVQIDFNEQTVDDNLIVPLVAGTVMLLVGKFI